MWWAGKIFRKEYKFSCVIQAFCLVSQHTVSEPVSKEYMARVKIDATKKLKTVLINNIFTLVMYPFYSNFLKLYLDHG